MYTKLLTDIISFLLCAVLAVPAAGAKAEEKQEQALYLGLEPVFSVCENSPLDSIREKAGAKDFDLTKTVEYADLVECGTFIRTDSPEELRRYLTGVNGFKEYRASSNYTLQFGDIVFKLDSAGKAESWKLSMGESKLQENDKYRTVHVLYPTYEEMIYLFLRHEMQYARPICCGIMANMFCESEFVPTALEETGQHGFGICQWTGDRQDEFKRWCSKNKLNRESLYTQLKFMQYELDEKSEFATLVRLMLHCSYDGDGAYDVAHVFCLYYEDPINAQQSAEDRGALAQDSFYKAYRKCK